MTFSGVTIITRLRGASRSFRSSPENSRCEVRTADLNAVVQVCRHLSDDEKNQLHALLKKYEHLFDGTLGTWNNKPYNIELKEGAKPYHS